MNYNGTKILDLLDYARHNVKRPSVSIVGHMTSKQLSEEVTFQTARLKNYEDFILGLDDVLGPEFSERNIGRRVTFRYGLNKIVIGKIINQYTNNKCYSSFCGQLMFRIESLHSLDIIDTPAKNIEFLS